MQAYSAVYTNVKKAKGPLKKNPDNLDVSVNKALHLYQLKNFTDACRFGRFFEIFTRLQSTYQNGISIFAFKPFFCRYCWDLPSRIWI